MITYICLRPNENEEPILRVIESSKCKGMVLHDILLTTGFGLHLANHTLRLLDTGIDVKFESFKQYDELIHDINNVVVSRVKDVDIDTSELYKLINTL